MERALVTGEGAVITRDGYLLDETCGAFLDNNGVVPYGLEDLGDARFRLAVIPTRMERDPALLLKRPHWRNYGHWVVDAIGLVAFAATRMDVFQLVLVIPKEENPTLRATMLDLLGMIAPGARAREIPDDEVWRFSSLHYVTPIHLPARFHPARGDGRAAHAHPGRRQWPPLWPANRSTEAPALCVAGSRGRAGSGKRSSRHRPVRRVWLRARRTGITYGSRTCCDVRRCRGGGRRAGATARQYRLLPGNGADRCAVT